MASFDDYKIFYYVATSKNITKAAEKLYMSQPALTKSIQRLETELGYKLFLRSQKGVELTADGKTVFRMIAPACESLIESEKLLAANPLPVEEHIRISSNYYVANTYLADVVMLFKEQYPEAHVEIDCESSERKRLYVEQNLRDFFVDYNNLWLTPEEIRANKLHTKVLTTILDGIFVGDGLFHLAQREISLAELAEYPVILSTREYWEKQTYSQVFEKLGKQLKILPADGYSLRRRYAKEGYGIVITIADHASELLEKGEWKQLQVAEPLPVRELAVISKPQTKMSPMVKAFYNCLTEYFHI